MTRTSITLSGMSSTPGSRESSATLVLAEGRHHDSEWVQRNSTPVMRNNRSGGGFHRRQNVAWNWQWAPRARQRSRLRIIEGDRDQGRTFAAVYSWANALSAVFHSARRSSTIVACDSLAFVATSETLPPAFGNRYSWTVVSPHL